MAQSLAGKQPAIDGSQMRKMAALGVLAVVAAVVLFMQFRPSAEERQIRENYRNSQTPAAVTPTADPANEQQQVMAPSLQSQFQKANVQIEDLLAGVQRETFSYEDVRIQRNPMQPLVGAGAPTKFQTAEEGTSEELLSQKIANAIRSMKITGIIWDEIHPVAVVNDEIVHNGYVFSDTGITVAAIEQQRIIMTINEMEFPVELEEQ